MESEIGEKVERGKKFIKESGTIKTLKQIKEFKDSEWEETMKRIIKFKESEDEIAKRNFIPES